MILTNSIILLYEHPADATDLFFFAIFGIVFSCLFFIWQLLKRLFPRQIEATENIRLVTLIFAPNIVIVLIPLLSFIINLLFGFSIIDSFTDNYFEVVFWTIMIVSCVFTVRFLDTQEVRYLLFSSLIILFILSTLYLLLFN
jgi:hypothetical protein